MDSYDRTLQTLEAITKEGGWFVYCIELEEWHLYNEDEELLRKAPVIERLLDTPKCPYKRMRVYESIPKRKTLQFSSSRHTELRKEVPTPMSGDHLQVHE